MAFLLLVSALVGVVIGWWAKRVSQRPSMKESEKHSDIPDDFEINDDIYVLKNRLDKCFDENASLRRDVKVKETQLNRLNARSGQIDDRANDTSSEILLDKVTALMDDLQLRDDTILTLEKEIEAMKSTR